VLQKVTPSVRYRMSVVCYYISILLSTSFGISCLLPKHFPVFFLKLFSTSNCRKEGSTVSAIAAFKVAACLGKCCNYFLAAYMAIIKASSVGSWTSIVSSLDYCSPLIQKLSYTPKTLTIHLKGPFTRAIPS
jgi:hypothetical protein